MKGFLVLNTSETPLRFTDPVPCFNVEGTRCLESFLGDKIYEIVAKRSFSMFRLYSFSNLLTVSNFELFNIVKPGACEVFEKVLTTLKLSKLEKHPVFLTSQPFILSYLQEYKFETPLEILFTALLVSSNRLSEIEMQDTAAISDIVKNHIAMYESAIIDSPSKFNAVMDPFSSQLGFEHSALLRATNIKFEAMNFLKNNPEHIEFFKLMSFALNEMSLPDWTLLKDIDLVKASKTIKTSYVSHITLEEIPSITNQAFKNKVLNMTIAEVKKLCWVVPSDVSDTVLEEILDKNVKEYHDDVLIQKNSNYTQLFSGYPTLTKTFDEILPTESDHSGVHVLGNTLAGLCLGKGHRKFFESYFGNKLNLLNADTIRTAVHTIEEISKVVLSYSNPEVYLPFTDHFDYVLLKMVEFFGADKTLEIMKEMYENNSSMTVMEWLGIIDNYDEIKDLPVAWWASLT